MIEATQNHWDAVYGQKAVEEVSWYEPHAETSLDLIRRAGVPLDNPIIDGGSGASFLVEDLLAAGYRDVTVLDISAQVLGKLRERLGSKAPLVTMLHRDVTRFEPDRCYALWHDRA